MAESREIISVTSGMVGATKTWTVEYRRPDGTLGGHLFPKDTLLWRALEYGIDINDVDTLLDVILHEPLIPDPTEPANHGTDPAAQRGYTVVEPGVVDEIFGVMARPAARVPVWLYNAPDVAAARAAHLIRVEHCKSTKAAYSRHSGKGADPLDAIRAEHRQVIALIEQVPAVAAVHARMRDHIRVTREQAAVRAPQVQRSGAWAKDRAGRRP